MAILDAIVTHPFATTSGILIFVLLGYVVYQRFFHPLAGYPGPFLASLTDLWQAHQFMTLKQPYLLTELHEKYGPFVRYGPDKLSITDESAIPIMFQKGGKSMPKTEFYDAYGSAHPNVFGMRDETQHSIRRRHMSYGFSMAYVKQMEKYLDLNIGILKSKLASYAATNEVFDLKKAFHYYMIDTIGELVFSQSFEIQITDDESRVPPVKEHSLLAAVTGALPAALPTLKKYLPLVPHKGLQNLFAGRQACADLAARCVEKRLNDLNDVKDQDGAAEEQRKDILTNLILAKDPDTGKRLTQMDLETEAFGFIIAGTHTTSATTSLLFYFLLHNPEILSKCVQELDSSLPELEPDQTAYKVSVAEASLPYMRNCIKENFRIAPVFTMPLARRVMAPGGVTIGGKHIQYGTSVAVCNHAFHHNPDVWGSDHNVFNPSRWDNPETAERARLLMHFGLGGRQCIGKTVATTNIYKLLSTLLREFEFELADGSETKKAEMGMYRGQIPEMVSVGISDLKERLMVRVKQRRKADGSLKDTGI